MKLLKIKKPLLGLILVSLLILPLFGFAYHIFALGEVLDIGVPDIGVTKVINAPDINVMRALQRIMNYLFTILLVVAAIFIIIAGYYFITAAGSVEQIAKARNFVLYAIVGVMVAFLAQGLVRLVAEVLGSEYKWWFWIEF